MGNRSEKMHDNVSIITHDNDFQIKKTNTCKLVLAGDTRSGKSSVVIRFVKNEWDQYKFPTIGATFLTQRVSINDNIIKFEMWDGLKSNRKGAPYKALAPMYYMKTDVLVSIYDITDETSIESATGWIKEIRTNVGNHVVCALVANKLDLTADRKISTETGRTLAKELNCIFYEVSAKNGTNIRELFREIGRVFLTQPPGIDHQKRAKKCLDELGWKQQNGFGEEYIDECFHTAITSMDKRLNIKKITEKECKQYVDDNLKGCNGVNGDNHIMIALEEMYNIPAKLYEYDYEKQDIIQIFNPTDYHYAVESKYILMLKMGTLYSVLEDSNQNGKIDKNLDVRAMRKKHKFIEQKRNEENKEKNDDDEKKAETIPTDTDESTSERIAHLQQANKLLQNQLIHTQIENQRHKEMIINLREENEERKQNPLDIKGNLLRIKSYMDQFGSFYNKDKLNEIYQQSPDTLFNDEECETVKLSVNAFITLLCDIQSHIMALNQPNPSKYTTWNLDVMMRWIESLEDGRFVKYSVILRNGFESDGILSASLLPSITKNDLRGEPFVIKDFSDRNALVQHFQNLRQNQIQNENNNNKHEPEDNSLQEGVATEYI